MNADQKPDFTALSLPDPGDQPALADFNQYLTGLKTEELLSWMVARFGGEMVFTTSLGAEDQIILDKLQALSLSDPAALAKGRPRLASLDTGRLPPETYDVLAADAARYPEWPITVYFPLAESVQDLVNSQGINLFRRSVELRKACCAVRKVEPLGRALAEAKAWMSGLRRDQAPTRGELSPLAWDASHRVWKLSPLWDWTKSQVDAYLAGSDLPRNILHSQGFPSIGCAPCTRAVGTGEDERAGRWWWESPEHKECGLHQDPLATGAKPTAKPSAWGIGSLGAGR